MCLFVGYYRHDRFGVVGHFVNRAFAAVAACRHIGPQGFDFGFDGIDIDVAHHHDGLQIGAVPFAIVVAQSLIREVVDDGRVANHIALGILRAREYVGVGLFPHTPAGSGTRTPLFANDTAFGINLVAQQRQGTRPIVHHQQGAVDDALAIGRHVGQAIDRFVERGVGVDVTTKIDANRLEIVDDAFAGEMLGAVESHVFEEVCQTVLVVFFENGAHRLRDVKLGALFRLFVVANVISQSVVQLTIAHIGVERQRLRFLLCKKRRCT